MFSKTEIYNIVGKIYDGVENAKSLKEYLNVLESFNKESLHLLFSPNGILSDSFKYVKTVDDANNVAEVFMKCFGDIIVCRDDSYDNGKILTIMDMLDDKKYCNCVVSENYMSEYALVKKAFNDKKFKRSYDCEFITLLKIYCNDKEYVNDLDHVINNLISNYEKSKKTV